MFSPDRKGSLYAILSGFLYGFIGYFGVSAMNAHLSASNMLFWRFSISSAVILIFIIPQIKNIRDSWTQIAMAFVSGAFFYGFSTLLYFYSSVYIGSGLAMVLFFTYPVIVMLLNYFLYGQTIPRLYYLATVIILSGMLMMIDMNQISYDVLGIVLATLSAFCYACYLVSCKKNKISANLSTLMVSLGCMSTNFLVALGTSSFEVPASMDIWWNLLGIGIIATVIPLVLMLHSLKYISSVKASILSVLEPVFVVILGVLLLGEELKPWHALGIVFVLTGALLTLFSPNLSLAQLRAYFLRLMGIAESNH